MALLDRLLQEFRAPREHQCPEKLLKARKQSGQWPSGALQKSSPQSPSLLEALGRSKTRIRMESVLTQGLGPCKMSSQKMQEAFKTRAPFSTEVSRMSLSVCTRFRTAWRGQRWATYLESSLSSGILLAISVTSHSLTDWIRGETV